MKTLHAMMLAFNTIDLIHGALELFEQQKGAYPIAQKTVFDAHFPLNTREAVRECAEKFGWHYVDMGKNLGVHGGYHFAIKNMSLDANSILYGCDPDERPQQAGYLDAIMEVFEHRPDCFYCGLNQPGMPPSKLGLAGSTFYLEYPQVIAWPAGAFHIGWMQKVNGPVQPHSQYGHIEVATTQALASHGATFLMLRDYYDVHLPSSPLLTKWKAECAGFRTQLDFESWLNQQPKQ